MISRKGSLLQELQKKDGTVLELDSRDPVKGIFFFTDISNLLIIQYRLEKIVSHDSEAEDFDLNRVRSNGGRLVQSLRCDAIFNIKMISFNFCYKLFKRKVAYHPYKKQNIHRII